MDLKEVANIIKDYQTVIAFVIFIFGYLWKGKKIINNFFNNNTLRTEQIALNAQKLALLEEQMLVQGESSKAVLHDKIYKYCGEYISEKEVSAEDLHNLEVLFKSYKDLGGNGTAEALFNKVVALPIKTNKNMGGR